MATTSPTHILQGEPFIQFVKRTTRPSPPQTPHLHSFRPLLPRRRRRSPKPAPATRVPLSLNLHHNIHAVPCQERLYPIAHIVNGRSVARDNMDNALQLTAIQRRPMIMIVIVMIMVVTVVMGMRVRRALPQPELGHRASHDAPLLRDPREHVAEVILHITRHADEQPLSASHDERLRRQQNQRGDEDAGDGVPAGPARPVRRQRRGHDGDGAQRVGEHVQVDPLHVLVVVRAPAAI